MDNRIYAYILVMALVTYLIRMLPLTLIRGVIKNRFLQSFLYYVPYVTLAVMTFPAILSETDSIYSGLGAFLVVLFLSFKGKGLIVVSLASCAVVFCLELLLVP